MKVKADVDALQETINKAEEFMKEKDKYTEETIKSLQNAVDNAKNIFADLNATLEMGEKAVAEILEAIDNLKLI